MPSTVHVVAAAIERNGQFLCARRGGVGPLVGMWEFPGGKVEAGEEPTNALQREIHEELNVRIEVGQLVTDTIHHYDFAQVRLMVFRCSLLAGEPRLTDHTEIRWVPPTQLNDLDWAPADLPSVAALSSAPRVR